MSSLKINNEQMSAIRFAKQRRDEDFQEENGRMMFIVIN